jgi:hypothetical protein
MIWWWGKNEEMDGVSTHIARDDLLEMKWVSHTVFDLLPLD